MKSKQALSSKERVQLSLSWQEPDRVPIQAYLTPEVEARLHEHFAHCGGAAGSMQVEPGVLASSDELILTRLGVDFRMVWPHYRGELRPPEDGIVYDEWGTGYRRVSNSAAGTYDESAVLPLADLKSQCDGYADYAVVFGHAGIPDILNGVSRGRLAPRDAH